jgi:uncharacterized protein (TIGR04255 family)
MMGKPLKNPPVYFTVAQVRFNALLKLADYLPSIQEALRRAGYPAFTQHSSVALQFIVQDGQPVPQPVPHEQYLFANVAQTHCFVLNPEALTFQSTDYGTFELFSQALLKGLALMHEVVTLDFTERVGLRYLDHVFPKTGEGLNQYLAPEVQGMSARLGGQPLHSYSETVSAFGDIKLRSRVVVQEGGLSFPPDLLPRGMAVQARFVQAEGKHAVLDTDGFVEGRQLFSLETVGQQLHEIHEVIGTAFRATVTEHALNVWDE